MFILDGREAANAILDDIRQDIITMQHLHHLRPPALCVIIVGNNPASEVYVQSKVKHCQLVGITSQVIAFDENITTQKLLAAIQQLNEDENIDGVIVQMPLPNHLDHDAILKTIHYTKDVDGFAYHNMGQLVWDKKYLLPATPYGIMLLFKYYNIQTQHKHIVIVGRSSIVSKPLALLFLNKDNELGNATVTVCHSFTPNISTHTKQADILIVAIGKANFITSDMIKKDCVVIDVGINKIKDDASPKGYKIVGDVDFNSVAPVCAQITPVPKGVGLMTIAGLLKNTCLAYKNTYYHHYKK